MKVLKKGLLDANMLFNEEQAKVTRQQNVKNSETQNPRVRRPQAPLSPLVNPSVLLLFLKLVNQKIMTDMTQGLLTLRKNLIGSIY